MESLYVQGRKLEAKDLEWIRELIEAHRDWNRTKLSEYIAQNWGWRNEVGRLKDMACRTMLLKLEQKGLLCLPARQRPSNNRCSWRPGPLPISQYPLPSPIESRLRAYKEWPSLTGCCGVIIIYLTAERSARTSGIWLLIVMLVRWPACFMEQRPGSSPFGTGSLVGVRSSAKPT